MATRKRAAARKTVTRRRTDTLRLYGLDAGVEGQLHAACVKAGAGAALQVALDRLPLLKPFLPDQVTRAAASDAPERIQREMIKEIYSRYELKPARWELEGILAVAQTQAVLSPLATRHGLEAVVNSWLPKALSGPLLRYTPLEPLITATAKAVAATWAAGRYADSVCRLRKAGADWLPAPLQDALALAPSTLRAWSAEALSLAMPPLRFAGRLTNLLPGLSAPAKPTRKPVRAAAKKSPPRKRKSPA